MNLFNLRKLAIITILFAFSAGATPGQPLINGDFEITSLAPGPEPAGYYYRALNPGNTNITGWITTRGYDPAAPPGVIEYVRGYYQDPLQSMGGLVELGTYNTLAGIQQTFATVPNRSYTISFYLASDPMNLQLAPAILRVSAGSNVADYAAPLATGSQENLGWQLKQFNFMADNTGMTTLQFWNVQGLPAIDGVSIVPEPQCFTILGLAGCYFVTSAFRAKTRRPVVDGST